MGVTTPQVKGIDAGSAGRGTRLGAGIRGPCCGPACCPKRRPPGGAKFCSARQARSIVCIP